MTHNSPLRMRTVTSVALTVLILNLPQLPRDVCHRMFEAQIQSAHTAAKIEADINETKKLGSDYPRKPAELTFEVILFEGATYTAALIAENWCTVFEKWGLNNKVIAIVTYGTANMKCALLLTSIQGLMCSIHNLQVVLKDSCFIKSSVSNLISAGTKIIAHFYHSVNSSKVLRKTQATLGVPEHELI
ncbi:hypothetical protein PR048_001813 [Dryococelus australis]|uniref:Uncharacterized protein n=1 Tax=Dryococelus australis TaxID=614101 RepID=A0ABQ9IJS5_9NEOP|nr:hypothetical protein PR048_001813 [Dryococelus australis]